jgi:hypothetical protein
MAENNAVLKSIQSLEQKLDALSNKFGACADATRLDNETIAVITACAYSLFGKRVSIRSVKLIK